MEVPTSLNLFSVGMANTLNMMNIHKYPNKFHKILSILANIEKNSIEQMNIFFLNPKKIDSYKHI